MEHLTRNFHALLLCCQGDFGKPSFVLFCAIMTGWVVSVRHVYVTELIYASGNVAKGHWSRFHRFFSHNAWSLDAVSMTIASLLIEALVPDGVIVLACGQNSRPTAKIFGNLAFELLESQKLD